MIRRIILLLCLAFVVVCYAYPCLILPLGSYKGEIESLLGDKTEVSYTFKFNGEVEMYSKSGDTTNKETTYYKIKGKQILFDAEKDWDHADSKMNISNFYTLDLSIFGEATNVLAIVIAGAVGVLAIVAIVTPSRRR